MNTNPMQIACDLLHGQAALAREIGVSPQAVGKWVKAKQPPPKRVIAIERATRGRVTRYDLRPDLYPKAETAA